MIYTSRFANPVLKYGEYTAARISVGAPRWKLGYQIAGAIPALTPKGLRHIKDVDTFRPLYYARLDSFGVEKIRKELQYFESFGKSVVLLCFEDLRLGDPVWRPSEIICRLVERQNRRNNFRIRGWFHNKEIDQYLPRFGAGETL